MKKSVVILLTVMLLITNVAFAEDYSSMTNEELYDIINAVYAELFQRNQSEIDPKPNGTDIEFATLPYVIYEDEIIAVTVIQIEDATSIRVSFQNKTNEDIELRILNVAVNNCMLYVSSSGNHTISKGKRAIIDCSNSSALDFGLNSVETLLLRFRVNDTDIVCSMNYNIQKEPSFVPNSGFVYENEFIKVFLICKSKKFDDMTMIFYNKTDDIVKCEVIDADFNDIVITSVQDIFSVNSILPHCYYRTDIGHRFTFSLWSALGDEIENNQLEPINKIGCKVKVINTDNWKTISLSDELTILVDYYLDK